jgi:DNA-binding beta-propeller fold protein YncE
LILLCSGGKFFWGVAVMRGTWRFWRRLGVSGGALLPAAALVFCTACGLSRRGPEQAGAAAEVPEQAALSKTAVVAAPPEPAPAEPPFPYTLLLKPGPGDMKVFLNDKELDGALAAPGIRRLTLEGPGILRLEAETYRGKQFRTSEIPGLLRDGQFQVKLETEGGRLAYTGEIPTGRQPKSAYFSPEGDRLFVPLLGQPGVDVFRFDSGPPDGSGSAPPSMRFEKRLAVPGSRACGFVEALCDRTRRELWVSNMEENRVHIFDLDTLEYKRFVDTGGLMPKVIVQSPGGDLTAVSNWLSRNISIFDSQTKARLALIPLGGTPRGMAFSPDGASLYAAIFDEPAVAVVDMAAKKVRTRYRLYEGTGAARHVIYSEGKLFVSDMYRGRVCTLDAAAGTLLKAVRVGPNINTIVLSPGGERLYASSRGRNNPQDYTKPGPEFGAVYVLSAADLSPEEKVWGRNQPTGLAVSPDGQCLVFTDFLDDNLEVYRIR